VADLTLTSPQVVDIVRQLDGEDLHPRTLAAWAQMGVAVPSFWPKKRGRYSPRQYTLADVARVRLVVQLRAAGLSMPRVRVILATVEDRLPDVLKRKTTAKLIVDGWTARVARPGRADVDLPSGQLSFNFADVIEGTRDAARKVKNQEVA